MSQGELRESSSLVFFLFLLIDITRNIVKDFEMYKKLLGILPGALFWIICCTVFWL